MSYWMVLFSEWMSSIHWIRLWGQIISTGDRSSVSLPPWNSSGWTLVENKWEGGMMNAAVRVWVCCWAEKEKPSFLTTEMLSWVSKFGLGWRNEEQPLPHREPARYRIKMRKFDHSIRIQARLHCGTRRFIEEAATTLVLLEKLPLCPGGRGAAGSLGTDSRGIFSSLGVTLSNRFPFLTASGCEAVTCSQEVPGQGTLLQKPG